MEREKIMTISNTMVKAESMRNDRVVWVPLSPKASHQSWMEYPIFKGDGPEIVKRVEQIRAALQVAENMAIRHESQLILEFLIKWIDRRGGERSRGEGKRKLERIIKYLRDTQCE